MVTHQLWNMVEIWLYLKVVSRGRVISTKGNFRRYPIAPFPLFICAQVKSLMFVKWKYTAHEKRDVKVDQFLKIVWEISNLNKSRRLIYKIRNFPYAIWVECLVNKLSQIRDVNSGFIRHIVEKWWPIWVHSWLKG